MLLIRGNTRVADIYLTEFDRIFRHFYSRDAANSIAKHGGQTHFGLLEETDRWTNDYFDISKPQNHRREMFFADPAKTWQAAAQGDPDVFEGEGTRAARGANNNTAGKGKAKKKSGAKGRTAKSKKGVKKKRKASTKKVAAKKRAKKRTSH